MVALNLFRSLDSSQRLPDELGTSGLICLHHCKRTLDTSERYWEAWPGDDYSIMNIYPLYHVAITLLHMLRDNQSHDLFERVCALLARFAGDFPLARYILQAWPSVCASLYPVARSRSSASSSCRRRSWLTFPQRSCFQLMRRCGMCFMRTKDRKRMECSRWASRWASCLVSGPILSLRTDD
jgi:hypothetical protein